MKKVVLIVEDNPKSLQLFRDLLQASGYATLEATDGKKAVELAKAHKPDLILMDILMPIMDGLEATKAIRNLECGMPALWNAKPILKWSVVGGQRSEVGGQWLGN